MARRINDFFFESDPPKIELPKDEQTFQDISLEKEPSMLAAPVDNEAQSPVSIEQAQEQNTLRDEFLGYSQNQDIDPPTGFRKPGTNMDNTDVNPNEVVSNATPEQSAEVTPEKKDHYKTLEEIKAETEAGYNPLVALMQQNKPELDKKRQERLQRIAAVNSIGKGLGTVLQGFYGKRGATIPEDKSTLLPETYKEYIANQKEHEGKMDLWNKDMLSLSLKKQGDIDRKVEKERDTKRADEITAEAAARQKAQFDAQMNRQKEQFDAEMEYKNKIAAAKTPDDIALLQQQHKNRMAEIYATYANQQKLQTQAIEAGKWQPRTGSSNIVARSGAEDAPLAFRRKNGEQVYLRADQLDIVEALMNQASGNGMTMESLNFGKDKDRIMKDGKITEAEAREIIGKYGDDYYDFVPDENGHAVAVPKGSVSSSTVTSTGGRY